MLSNAILQIRAANADRKPVVTMVEGKEYLSLPNGSGSYELVKDPRQPQDQRATARTLSIATLAGLVDYIEANIDGLKLDEHLVTIQGPLEVELVSKLMPSHLGDHPPARERDVYVQAVAEPCGWQFGKKVPQEEFVLGVMLNFVETTERQDLLSLVGNVRSEVVSSAQDDGVTQMVEGRYGVSLKAAVPVKNPWMLAPYRTFREVEQVASACVLRVHRNGVDLPLFSLHEADGAGWTVEASARVAAWLRVQLGDLIRVLA